MVLQWNPQHCWCRTESLIEHWNHHETIKFIHWSVLSWAPWELFWINHEISPWLDFHSLISQGHFSIRDKLCRPWRLQVVAKTINTWRVVPFHGIKHELQKPCKWRGQLRFPLVEVLSDSAPLEDPNYTAVPLGRWTYASLALMLCLKMVPVSTKRVRCSMVFGKLRNPGVGGALCTGVVVRVRGETPLVRLRALRATPERPGGRQLSESGAAVLHGLPWLHRCGAEPAAAAPSQADRLKNRCRVWRHGNKFDCRILNILAGSCCCFV